MATGTAPQGDVYTTAGAGTYNVPAGRSMVWVTMQAAGGGGNGPAAAPFGGGGGAGGSGESCFRVPYTVTPGGTVAYTVGAGGVGAGTLTFGAAGGDTIFGALRCKGGVLGTTATQTHTGGDAGGGANRALPTEVAGTGFGQIGAKDGPLWWGGSSGGPNSSGSNPARKGGPAAGRVASAASSSADRGGGPGAATVFANGIAGCNEATNGSNGVLGGGGGGGGGGTGGLGGTGGNGYILIEYY